MYIFSFRTTSAFVSLISLHFNSEREHLHRDLMQFNKSTLNSDSLASLVVFPSVSLCRQALNKTCLRNGWQRVGTHAVLYLFS